jgi:exonuclease-1
MGIDDGKLVVGVSRNSRLNTLNELRGKTLGVDINLWLYEIINANKSMLMKLFMDPVQDITFDLHSELDKRCNILRSSGISLFFVFDGVPNPRKAHTNAKRKGAAVEALDELKLLLRDTVDAETKKIITLANKALRIDEDITSKVIEYCKKKGIPCIQAAFEADPQLYMLEKLGIVDGIISEDTDYIYLGCKLFVCDTIFKIDEGVMNCNIVRHDSILQFLKEKLDDHNNFLVSEDLALLGTLLGSDFHKFDPKHHVGVKKATDIIIEYVGQKSSSSMNIDLLVGIVKNKLPLWGSTVEEDVFITTVKKVENQHGKNLMIL